MPARRKTQNSNGRPVWADVSLSALAHNLHAIRDFVNPKSENRSTPRKVLCIVKGNGYGHGGPQEAQKIPQTRRRQTHSCSYHFLARRRSATSHQQNFTRHHSLRTTGRI